MTVHQHPAVAEKSGDAELRTTRLERAMAEAMKIQEGPELLAKITSREFKDAFQAIAVQQRGTAGPGHYDAAAIPVVVIGYDPDYPEDKSKQLYVCRLGAAILNPESAKSLQAAAAKRGIRFVSTPQSDFNSNQWLKAVAISIYSNDLDELIQLINDELIEKIRPDARVTYADVMRVGRDEIGKLFT